MALKFQITPGASGTGLTFHILREEGEVLSAAGAYADREACLAAIHEAVDTLNEAQPFAIQAVPGGQTLELRAQDGRALARSLPLSAQAATALQEALEEAASEQEEYEIDLPPTMTSRAQTLPAFLSAARAVSADDYDFAQPSSSGLAGFEPFQNVRDGRHYFHFNDERGQALLYSRGFGDASQRNKRIGSVIAGGAAAQRYEQRTEEGRHFFILKGRNGQEIARSRAFPTPGEMEAAITGLLLEMPQQAEQYAQQTGVRKTRKRGENRFNLGLASLTGLAGFELLKNASDRLHYFLFNDDAGRPILFSQGYKTRGGRDQGVQSLIRLGANPARYEAAEEGGQPYFAVRAGNRQEIARSRGFESAAAATAAMALLQTRLPASAAAFGVAPEMLETAAGEHLTIRREREEAPAAAAVLSAAAGVVSGADFASPIIREAAPLASVENAAPSATSAPIVFRTRPLNWRRALWLLPLALLAVPALAWMLHNKRPSPLAHPAVVQSANLLVPAAPLPPARLKPRIRIADSLQERKTQFPRRVSPNSSARRKPAQTRSFRRLPSAASLAAFRQSYSGGS